LTAFDQATAAHRQGRLEEAARLYAQALAAEPQHREAAHMLGVIRAQQGRHDEAHALIAPVAAAEPGNARAQGNLANVLNSLGRAEEALAAFGRSLALNPAQPDAWLNRGGALQQLGRRDEALASIDRALALNPNHAPAWFRRGGLLQLMLRYDEAVASYDQTLTLMPQLFEAWNNRGHALQQLGRLDDAMESFRRSEAISPQPLTRLNQGMLHLLRQDFARGLPLYEERKRLAPPMEARSYPQPLWTGREDINGKTLFAYIEQGFGDTIQFFRYAARAQARGARVILSVPDNLVALLARATPPVELIGWQKAPPQFDYHIPLASIPLAVGMTQPFSPGRYLSADPARVAAWKQKLGDHGRRIAIAWQGNEAITGSEGKSVPLAAFAPIAAIPGVRLISVQKGLGSEQLDNLPPGMTVERHDFDSGPDGFLDTAAILEACDMAIMSDTGPAHLAGALGRPVWVALKLVPDWRWFMNRADTPWYESMRLFRQPALNDWTSVFAAMAAALSARNP
jgi:tetratricopeptide (TPR) repeat protein